MSKPTANEDDPRAQPAAVGAWDNYVDPHPDGDEPRPRDPHATACPATTPPPPQRCGNNTTEDDEVGPRAQHTTASVQGNYVNPHTDDDEPRPRDDHAAPCPAATTPRLPPPRPRRRAAREAELPVGSTRPLHRRAAAKMSPRIRTGPEAVLTAHAPTPSAAAATARRKPDQVPIPEQNFFRGRWESNKRLRQASAASISFITQQPERQFTSEFVCVKARETSFVINKILCQKSKFQNFAEHLNF